MAGKTKWIKGAVKPSHEGLFTKKSEAAGKSVHEYAEEKKGASGALGKEARLALTFEKMGHKKKPKTHSDMMNKLYKGK